MRFHDRCEAGKLLAAKLQEYAGQPDVIVLALPRGGVPVGYEISRSLRVPLDVLLVRKLGVPGAEELAMGAIAIKNVTVLNQQIIDGFEISSADIQHAIQEQQQELVRRNQYYRQNRPFPDLKNHIVILVDDGLATGATMQAALNAINKMRPKEVIIAVPVAAQETFKKFKEQTKIICLQTPKTFFSVGEWYETFPQTSDEEVCDLLARAQTK